MTNSGPSSDFGTESAISPGGSAFDTSSAKFKFSSRRVSSYKLEGFEEVHASEDNAVCPGGFIDILAIVTKIAKLDTMCSTVEVVPPRQP